MRVTVIVVVFIAFLASLIYVAAAEAGITRIPHRCTHAAAPRLCSLHFHKARTDRARRAIGRPALRYQWAGERFPQRRNRLLAYWIGQQRYAERALAHERRSPSITEIITRIFGSAAPAAISVARCESGLNPTAHNPSGASGLFQLMPSWWAGRYNPYDPTVNTRLAHNLYEASGWRSWTCQP